MSVVGTWKLCVRCVPNQIYQEDRLGHFERAGTPSSRTSATTPAPGARAGTRGARACRARAGVACAGALWLVLVLKVRRPQLAAMMQLPQRAEPTTARAQNEISDYPREMQDTGERSTSGRGLRGEGGGAGVVTMRRAGGGNVRGVRGDEGWRGKWDEWRKEVCTGGDIVRAGDDGAEGDDDDDGWRGGVGGVWGIGSGIWGLARCRGGEKKGVKKGKKERDERNGRGVRLGGRRRNLMRKKSGDEWLDGCPFLVGREYPERRGSETHASILLRIRAPRLAWRGKQRASGSAAHSPVLRSAHIGAGSIPHTSSCSPAWRPSRRGMTRSDAYTLHEAMRTTRGDTEDENGRRDDKTRWKQKGPERLGKEGTDGDKKKTARCRKAYKEKDGERRASRIAKGAQTTHGREASAPLRPLPIGRVSHGKRRSPGRERRTRHRPAAYRTPPRVTAPRVASLPIVALCLAHPRGWQRRMNPRIESHASRHGRSKKKRRREIRGEDKKSAKEKKKKQARTYLVCHPAFAAPRRPPSAHELLHRGSLFVGRRCARRLRRARVTNWSKSSWSILEKTVRKTIGKTEIAMSKTLNRTVFDAASAAGCTFWDTADAYADSEELIGKWFKRTGKRDQIFISAKFELMADFTIDGSPTMSNARQSLPSRNSRTDHKVPIEVEFSHIPGDE
ncbi:hypothetical protein C8J57DRAFT_1226149 [Mycena rebaudengoi]|nr:hypothetical protein C8J57DRAFT_1226149 [Mycena rebaudengoi]